MLEKVLENIAESLRRIADAVGAAPKDQEPSAEPVRMDIPGFDAETGKVVEQMTKPGQLSDEAKAGFSTGSYANLTRDALAKLCDEREIPVPDRSRTPTLIKLLTEWDAKQGVKCDAQGNTNFTSNDPLNEPDPLSDPDPLEDPLADPPAEAPVSREEVTLALQKLQKAKGNAAVSEVLKTAGGGATLLRDVKDTCYSAVKRAAEKMM